MQNIIIYSIITGALLLLALILSTSRQGTNVIANRWLSVFLISYGCITVDFVFFAINLYDEYPSVQGLLEITRLGMAPALYFSVLYFTTPNRQFLKTDLLHFLPFFLFFLFILSVLTHINESAVFDWYRSLPEGIRRVVALTMFASVKVQMIVYWFLSYFRLHRHQKNIKLFASSLDTVGLSWLRYFLLGLVVVLALSLNEVLRFLPAVLPITNISYMVITFYLGYFSLRQQEVYPYAKEDVAQLRLVFDDQNQSSAKVQRMSPEEVEQIKQRLISLMETQKPYLNPELGLPQLATLTELSTHNLSYVINEGFNENFFQFINRYRIEEAKILLRSPKHKHLNVLGIGLEAGFRSKTTFNTTFRKLTGLSPSQFMDESDVKFQAKIL